MHSPYMAIVDIIAISIVAYHKNAVVCIMVHLMRVMVHLMRVMAHLMGVMVHLMRVMVHLMRVMVHLMRVMVHPNIWWSWYT